MSPQLQITFRNMRPINEAQDWIREKVDKLNVFCNQLIECRVAVELPHRHHRRGNQFHICIDLVVPQGEIVVKHEPKLIGRAQIMGESKNHKSAELNIPHKDLRQAINDAFNVAGRRLQDYARRQRAVSAPMVRLVDEPHEKAPQHSTTNYCC